MNKNELLAELQSQFQAAETFKQAVTERYTESYQAYRGEIPPKTDDNDIRASRVMWESFESIYPTVLALFTNSNRSPVSFDSDDLTSGKLAKAITKAVHTAAMKVNNSKLLYMAAIKEILITGNQVACVGYDEKLFETEKYDFDNSPAHELVVKTAVIMKAGYNIDQEITVNDDQTVTGWIKGTRTIKFPVLNLIAFSDFYIHPKATNIDDATYSAYRELITVAEGISRGYPQSKLAKGEKAAPDSTAGTSKQLLVVGSMNSDIDAPDLTFSEYNREITITHHYWRGCYQGKTPKLWHVVSTDTDILLQEQVDVNPLILGGMSIISGSAWSESLYDMCITAQTNKTRAMRAIQRSADGAAYGEYTYQENSIEADGLAVFLNERGPGAAYNVRSPNAIQKLQGTDVPNAMQLLNEEINEDVKATIQGSAGQAQALEENSQASGTAIALTQDKQELNENQIAETIAETFIIPMYRKLLMVMQEIGASVKLGSDHIPLKLIRSDIGLTADIKSVYDAAKAASNVKSAYENAAQLGTLPKNFQPENVYNIYSDYLRVATGQEDVSRYITAPEDMPQPSKAEQLLTALITIGKAREQIAATGLAEAKVSDMKADVAKKLNEALKDLATIKQMDAETKISMVDTLLKAQELEQNAANEVTQNAQEQERIDNTQEA
ncbi:TPA: hypothetical protein ACNIQM_001854 [Citrobacter werkmanii]